MIDPSIHSVLPEQIQFHNFASDEVLSGEWGPLFRRFQAQQAINCGGNVQIVCHGDHKGEVLIVTGMVSKFNKDRDVITVLPGNGKIPLNRISQINFPESKQQKRRQPSVFALI